MITRAAQWTLIAGLVVAAGSVWLLAGTQNIGKPISWSSDDVLVFVLPDSRDTIRVEFRSDQNLSDVNLRVTPSLEALVSARPDELRNIRSGRDYRVTLDIASPVRAGVKYEGALQLRAVGEGVSATPLPITVVVHDQAVPPDPGEAGRQTLEGVDADNDGVRDDVQRHIILLYPGNAPVRNALTQFAKANQDFIGESDSPEDRLLQVVADRHAASDCLNHVTGRPAIALALAQDLRSVLLNTQARSTAYVNADSRLSGHFFPITDPSTWHDSCE